MKPGVLAALLLGTLVVGCEEKGLKLKETENAAVATESASVHSPEEGERYAGFRFPDELPTILRTAERVGVEPELLLAIRQAENGEQGLQFGIIPTERYRRDLGVTENGRFRYYPDDGELEKQASWSAWTVRRNRERWEALPENERTGYEDFIDFLGDRYAPVGADNDPGGLNSNWERNVRFFYRQLSGRGN